MITLITGAPGAGKTSSLVKLLRELAKGRAIFVDGIPDLKVAHATLDDARKWPVAVPDGAAVVIDEVQRVWRPTSAGSKVPDDIAALETHRHRGIDFFIVTQHPKLVHSNVRALVGRHVHLRDIGVLGRWWYEWPECHPAPDTGWKQAPVKKKFRLDKSVHGLYTSATEHIKPIRSIPPALLILGAALIGCGVLGWMAYRTISAKMGGEVQQASTVNKMAAPGSAGAAAPGKSEKQPITARQLVTSFQPRVAELPETAPAFDHLRVVRSMPQIVGGFCRGLKCRCYTHQGPYPLPDDVCRAWVASPPFDPYRAPAQDRMQGGSREAGANAMAPGSGAAGPG